VGGLCEGAHLEIERVPLRAGCKACGTCFVVREWHWNCPACNEECSVLPGGDELELLSIEAEVPS
jgi:hydrogenase nickel incorporation protein HypA/HybF